EGAIVGKGGSQVGRQIKRGASTAIVVGVGDLVVDRAGASIVTQRLIPGVEQLTAEDLHFKAMNIEGSRWRCLRLLSELGVGGLGHPKAVVGKDGVDEVGADTPQ